MQRNKYKSLSQSGAWCLIYAVDWEGQSDGEAKLTAVGLFRAMAFSFGNFLSVFFKASITVSGARAPKPSPARISNATVGSKDMNGRKEDGEMRIEDGEMQIEDGEMQIEDSGGARDHLWSKTSTSQIYQEPFLFLKKKFFLAVNMGYPFGFFSLFILLRMSTDLP